MLIDNASFIANGLILNKDVYSNNCNFITFEVKTYKYECTVQFIFGKN